MPIFITVDDGADFSRSLILTPGGFFSDPSWRFNGPGLAGVTPTDWTLIKPETNVNVNANFSGKTGQLLMQLNSWGSPTNDPSVGDTGPGLYFGPPGSFGQATDNNGVIHWSIDDIH